MDNTKPIVMDNVDICLDNCKKLFGKLNSDIFLEVTIKKAQEGITDEIERIKIKTDLANKIDQIKTKLASMISSWFGVSLSQKEDQGAVLIKIKGNNDATMKAFNNYIVDKAFKGVFEFTEFHTSYGKLTDQDFESLKTKQFDFVKQEFIEISQQSSANPTLLTADELTKLNEKLLLSSDEKDVNSILECMYKDNFVRTGVENSQSKNQGERWQKKLASEDYRDAIERSLEKCNLKLEHKYYEDQYNKIKELKKSKNLSNTACQAQTFLEQYYLNKWRMLQLYDSCEQYKKYLEPYLSSKAEFPEAKALELAGNLNLAIQHLRQSIYDPDGEVTKSEDYGDVFAPLTKENLAEHTKLIEMIQSTANKKSSFLTTATFSLLADIDNHFLGKLEQLVNSFSSVDDKKKLVCDINQAIKVMFPQDIKIDLFLVDDGDIKWQDKANELSMAYKAVVSGETQTVRDLVREKCQKIHQKVIEEKSFVLLKDKYIEYESFLINYLRNENQANLKIDGEKSAKELNRLKNIFIKLSSPTFKSLFKAPTDASSAKIQLLRLNTLFDKSNTIEEFKKNCVAINKSGYFSEDYANINGYIKVYKDRKNQENKNRVFGFLRMDLKKQLDMADRVYGYVQLYMNSLRENAGKDAAYNIAQELFQNNVGAKRIVASEFNVGVIKNLPTELKKKVTKRLNINDDLIKKIEESDSNDPSIRRELSTVISACDFDQQEDKNNKKNTFASIN